MARRPRCRPFRPGHARAAEPPRSGRNEVEDPEGVGAASPCARLGMGGDARRPTRALCARVPGGAALAQAIEAHRVETSAAWLDAQHESAVPKGCARMHVDTNGGPWRHALHRRPRERMRRKGGGAAAERGAAGAGRREGERWGCRGVRPKRKGRAGEPTRPSGAVAHQAVTRWTGMLSARTIIDGAVFRLFGGHWDPVVERNDSWPGAAWSSTGQAAARLLRFATALRVTRRRPRDRVLPWP